MPGMKEIKNRINSVSDTQKITNAMYLIASTKLRKAKQDLDKTRPYFDSLRKEINRIFSVKSDIESIYFYPEGEGKRVMKDHKLQDLGMEDYTEAVNDLGGTYGYLVITADKGLAGAYNQNVIKEAINLMNQHEDNKLFVVGEAGRHYFDVHNIPIEESFLYTAQNPTLQRAAEISDILLQLYKKGELTKLYIIYTDMKNSICQDVCSARLLPFHRGDFSSKSGKAVKNEFEFVPSLNSVLDSIAPNYLTGFIYSALVDSFCCEQNARMMAMDSANTNAEKLLGELRLEFNHLRQNAITQEITEVAAGAKAKRKKLEKEKLKRKKESGL